MKIKAFVQKYKRVLSKVKLEKINDSNINKQNNENKNEIFDNKKNEMKENNNYQ